MFTFDLRGKQGILIFTLYNYRIGEGREYHAGYSTKKRLNSYAFYNIETNNLKIVHYDSIKARVYEGAIAAYTITPGERIIGLKGASCYYIDHNGQEVGYAGDNLFFYNYHIENNETNGIDSQSKSVFIQKQKTVNHTAKPEFIIDGKKIIYTNGEIFESKYLLKDYYKNTIVFYTI